MKQVVCAFMRDPAGRVLLARRAPGEHLAGYWELPGGKVEPGEGLAQALQRELQEELGLTLAVGDELGRNVHVHAAGRLVLIALAVAAPQQPMVLQVHDAVGWFTAAEAAAARVAPADIPLLQTLL